MFSTKSGGVGSSGISRGIAFRIEQIVSIAVLSVAYVSSFIGKKNSKGVYSSWLESYVQASVISC